MHIKGLHSVSIYAPFSFSGEDSLRFFEVKAERTKMQRSKNSTLILQSALLFLFIFVSKSYVCAQSLPPAKLDGFVYEKHRVDWDAILIEAFVDPVCPDSRDAWPALKQVLQQYGSRVALVVHLLPLPSVNSLSIGFWRVFGFGEKQKRRGKEIFEKIEEIN